MSQYVSARRAFNGLTRVDMEDYFDDMEIENLYQWIDRVPLTRPKNNLAKDFSDGVLVAEIIKHYFPRMVDLHNFSPAHSAKQKMENWYLLNRRVLQRLDLDLSDDVIRALANAKTKVIDRVLMMLRSQIDKAMERTNALKERTKQLQATLNKGKYDQPPGNMRLQKTASEFSSPSPMGNELVVHSPGKSPRGMIPHSHPARVGTRATTDENWRPGAYSTVSRPITLPSIAPPVDNVAKSLLEEKELESMAKDETIRILNTKLKRLEHLLHLKDLRIEDLESRLNHAHGLRFMGLEVDM